MFHQVSKHLEFPQKYSAARRIFNSLLVAWISYETLSLVLDILLKLPLSAIIYVFQWFITS